MPAMTLDWEEACELLDEGTVIDRDTWRWGTIDTYVCPKDGKFWSAAVRVHTQDGWQEEDTVNFYEVIQKEVMTKVWVLV